MGTATFQRRLGSFRGDARVFVMNPPLEGKYAKIIVSAVDVLGRPETYIFPANEGGDGVDDWGELAGSQKDTLSHTDVLRDLGYEIVAMPALPAHEGRALDPVEQAYLALIDELVAS